MLADMALTETVTIQHADRDEQRISLDLDYDGSICMEVADDEEATMIPIRMSTTEVERLIAKLSVKLAQSRMAA